MIYMFIHVFLEFLVLIVDSRFEPLWPKFDFQVVQPFCFSVFAIQL